MQQIARNYPDNLIRLRVCVFWPHDGVWYKGKVVKFYPASKKFKILYDDSRDENVDLTKENFIIEEKSSEGKKPNGLTGRLDKK